MKLQSTFACLLSTALIVSAKVPTIWLAGDSTTAPDGGHNGTEGWGQYLKYSFGDRAFVNNSAYAGRSARSVWGFIVNNIRADIY
jgi:rhamnogalacturonan acetylesterase